MKLQTYVILYLSCPVWKPYSKNQKIQSDITSVKQLSELCKKRHQTLCPKIKREIYLSISTACFAWACRFVLYRQWFHCISILKHATGKFSVLSIIFIDAHNFTHSGFPSLALNVLLKDYLTAQLRSFWNPTQEVCANNKTNSKKAQKAPQSSPKRRSNARNHHFGIQKSPYWCVEWTHEKGSDVCQGSIFRLCSYWTIKEWWIRGRIY